MFLSRTWYAHICYLLLNQFVFTWHMFLYILYLFINHGISVMIPVCLQNEFTFLSRILIGITLMGRKILESFQFLVLKISFL